MKTSPPSQKLVYCSRSVWRKIFFYKITPIFKMGEKVFYDRASTLPRIYVFSRIIIYNGKTWQPRLITRWRIGYKIGSFTWNRKLALYKPKKKKKK